MRRLTTWFADWRNRRRYAKAYAKLIEQGRKHLPHLDERRLEAWARHMADREVAS